MRRMHLGVIPVALGAALWLLPGPARESAEPAATPATADSLDDGPHVFWEDGRHAIAFYLCGDSIPAVRIEVSDTLTFSGLCADSTTGYHLDPGAPEPPPHTWNDVPRILAISDIEGEYDPMIAFLERAGVIDEAGHWTWGNGHLVVVGDLVDRGEHVTECLWFLHGLERQAEQAGGRVHIVLGNHEAMVMRGDIRYTHAKYTGGIVRYSGVRYPDLFGPDMELGRWLRSKPFVLKLNDIVFVHGGLGPDVVVRDLDIATINEVGRESLGLSSVALTFSDLPGFLLGSRGPLWYRGYFMGRDGYPVASPTEIDAVLHHLDASALVVGHTSIGRVGRFHDGRVFAVDVSLDELGTFEGLLWEDGAFSVVTGTGEIHELR